MIVKMITVKMIKNHPIVGVHALVAWSLENSVALPTRASLRIFFPSQYCRKISIPNGMRKNVRSAEEMNPERINILSDIEKNSLLV